MPSRSGQPLLEAAMVFLIAFAMLSFFADGNGYEGDDLNSVIPMLHLPLAFQVPEDIYKYDWQPLAYWTGHAAYRLTGTIAAIFTLSQIGIAAGIALLWLVMTRGVGVSGWMFVPIVMMFPEIIYTGLYYNATALGFPFAVLAVLLAFAGPGWGWAALSGLSLGIAVTMRIDYALVAPAIALFRLYHTRSVVDFIVAGAAGLLWLGLSLGIGLLDLERMLSVYATSRAEIVERAGQGGWNLQSKLLIATTIFSPLGWVVLLLGAGYFAVTATYRLWGQAALLLISLLPFFYAMQNLLSVKYMIPLFALLPACAALLWRDASARLSAPGRRLLAGLWGGLTVGLIFVAVDLDRQPPQLRITASDPRAINTHDGLRTWGAYLTAYSWVERRRPADRIVPRIQRADDFVSFAQSPSAYQVWMIGDRGFFGRGGLGWNLIYVRLELQGYHGVPGPDGTVSFDLPMGRLVLAPQGSVTPPDACAISLREVRNPVAFITDTCSG